MCDRWCSSFWIADARSLINGARTPGGLVRFHYISDSQATTGRPTWGRIFLSLVSSIGNLVVPERESFVSTRVRDWTPFLLIQPPIKTPESASEAGRSTKASPVTTVIRFCKVRVKGGMINRNTVLRIGGAAGWGGGVEAGTPCWGEQGRAEQGFWGGTASLQ